MMSIDEAAVRLGKTEAEVAAMCRGYVRKGEEPPPVPTAFDLLEDFVPYSDEGAHFVMRRERFFADGKLVRMLQWSVAKFDNVQHANAAVERANREGDVQCQSVS